MQKIRTVLLIASVLGLVAIVTAGWNGEAQARDSRAVTTTATPKGEVASLESGEPDVGQVGKPTTTTSRLGQGSEEPGKRWRPWAGWTAGMWAVPYFWIVPFARD